MDACAVFCGAGALAEVQLAEAHSADRLKKVQK